MTDALGPPGGGASINKQGGDALAGSLAYSGAFGYAGQGGGYGTGGEGSSDAGYVVGGNAGADAGPGLAMGGDGGVDQTTIGDINIST